MEWFQLSSWGLIFREFFLYWSFQLASWASMAMKQHPSYGGDPSIRNENTRGT